LKVWQLRPGLWHLRSLHLRSLHLWPLHLWPLHLWPLHLWPLHLWPLHLWPLHLWPLHLWPGLGAWPRHLASRTAHRRGRTASASAANRRTGKCRHDWTADQRCGERESQDR
jgi:hypothetical protein